MENGIYSSKTNSINSDIFAFKLHCTDLCHIQCFHFVNLYYSLKVICFARINRLSHCVLFANILTMFAIFNHKLGIPS